MAEWYEDGDLVHVKDSDDTGVVVNVKTWEDGEISDVTIEAEYGDKEVTVDPSQLETFAEVLADREVLTRRLEGSRIEIEQLQQKLAHKNIQLIQAGLLPIDVLLKLMPQESVVLDIVNESDYRFPNRPGRPDGATMKLNMAIVNSAATPFNDPGLSPAVFDAITKAIRDGGVKPGWAGDKR